MKTSSRVLTFSVLVALFTSAAFAAPPEGRGGGSGSGNAFGKSKKSTPTACQATQVAPTIDGSPAAGTIEGVAYAFTPSAADANCDLLTFAIDGKPAWATFNATTGELAGTPPAGTAGLYPYIVISVSDGYSATLLPPFSISVTPNSAPTISGTPLTQVSDGQAYGFRPTAADPDGQALRFSIANKPAWASFSSSTGQISGTPSEADAGVTSNVTISVSDGLATASLAPFSIEVLSTNVAPAISGAPPTRAQAGTGYAFLPSASDPDGDALRFGITNRPAWAAFDSATGRLSGTPASTDAGLHEGIVISVSDGQLSASLAPFSIEVVVPNSAPKIAGTPSTSVQAGTGYAFRPSASDADGDALRFSIANRPAWASFDTATGQLSGTPTSADAGTYGNIVISVSDGQLSASLAAFSIAVQQVSNGSVTLAWQPPAQRTDGSSLTNLAGYRIRYGTTAGSYPYQVTLNNPGLTSHVVENLPSGTYYFVMTAFDSSGVESAATNPVSKSIN